MKIITSIIILFAHFFSGSGNIYANEILKTTCESKQNIHSSNHQYININDIFDIDIEDDFQNIENKENIENETNIFVNCNYFANFYDSNSYKFLSNCNSNQDKNYLQFNAKSTQVYLKNCVFRI